MNYMGKRRIVYYKESQFKKAVVTFESGFKDIGRGVSMEVEVYEDDEKTKNDVSL